VKFIFEDKDIKEGLQVRNSKGDKCSIYRVSDTVSGWRYGITNDSVSYYVVTVIGFAEEMAKYLNNNEYKPANV